MKDFLGILERKKIAYGFVEEMARETGLEPAAFAVTGRRSNQLSYSRALLLKLGPLNDVFLVDCQRRNACICNFLADNSAQNNHLIY